MASPERGEAARQLESVQSFQQVLEMMRLLNELRVQSPDAGRVQSSASTDASKLKFSGGFVVQLVITIVTVALAIWGFQYGLRSDVRDILTRMEMQQKLNEDRNKALDSKIAEVRMQLTKSDTTAESLRQQVADLRERVIVMQSSNAASATAAAVAAAAVSKGKP